MINNMKKYESYIRNIIENSANFIFSIDKQKKLTIWNKTAEMITGYKSSDVLMQSIYDLDLFENSRKLLDIIEKNNSGEDIFLGNLILRAKNGEKKIIQISIPATVNGVYGSDIYDVIFIGEEENSDFDNIKGLSCGNSYLFKDISEHSAILLLKGFARLGNDCLLVTRYKPNLITNIVDSDKIKSIFLQTNKLIESDVLVNLEELVPLIIKFTEENKKSVIFLSRIDYLITKFSFEDFLDTIYQIDDIIADTNSLFIVHVNPNVLDKRQLSILEDEMQIMPSNNMIDIVLENSFYDILKFLDDEEANKLVISLKKIKRKMNITYPTIRKKLSFLKKQGLVIINKRGRMKEVHLTDKGKKIINKGRQSQF